MLCVCVCVFFFFVVGNGVFFLAFSVVCFGFFCFVVALCFLLIFFFGCCFVFFCCCVVFLSSCELFFFDFAITICLRRLCRLSVLLCLGM